MVFANGHEEDRTGERIVYAGPEGGPASSRNTTNGEVPGGPNRIRSLVTSGSSKLFFGALGAGLISLLLYWIFWRTSSNENRRTTTVPAALRR